MSVRAAAVFLICAATLCIKGFGAGALDLAGKPEDPFASPSKARVLIFVRTDCPITNRYAPELRRVATEFEPRGAEFWLVYPDPSQTAAGIERHMADYGFPGHPLLDPHHDLVHRAHATIAPEAAVFNAKGELMYHGRIDDLYVDVGKARPFAQTHDLEDAIAAVLDGRPVAKAETRAIGCSLADVQ